MPAQYRHLLSPISIGTVEVPNRIVRTAHATGLTITGDVSDLGAYHAEAARAGVGLTIIEAAAVHPTTTGRLRFEDDRQMVDYERMLRGLRKYPMKLFQQLVHAGRAFMTPYGDPPWSASSIPSPRIVHSELSQTPLAIAPDQIAEIVDSFAQAAARVVASGADGVEINAAHGYLIAQFMSPHTNKRDDNYGGPRENRVRILLELLRATRNLIGHEVPLGVRISADEMHPGAITTAESAAIVDILNATGLIDFLDVSLGSPMNVTKVIGGMEEPIGYELPYSAPVARHAHVPTIVAGRITSLAHGEQLIHDGVADMVALTRAHIADPALVSKSLAGSAHRVRPCIGCNQGCVGAASSPLARFGCTVNPSAGFEVIEAAVSRRPRTPKSVLVVGGGPAGMEAARTAAVHGDRVLLCEAQASLGGQLRIARKAPYRARLGEFSDWLSSELDELGVEVRLNTLVDAALVDSLGCDRVIVATGSVPRTDGFTIADPDRAVAGSRLPHVVSSWDIVAGDAGNDGSTLVYDDIGHHEAVSVAEALLARGADVTFVTRLNRLMPLLEHARMETTVKRRLDTERFRFIPDAKLVEIRAGDVTIESLYSSRTHAIAADLVCIVGANVAQRRLADQLHGRVDVTVVGDALGPRMLQLAVLEGHRAAIAPQLLPGSSRR